MNVHANRSKARSRRCNAPAPPTTADLKHPLTFAAAKWPIRNWITRKPPANAPIEIPICVHDPVVHEIIDVLGRPIRRGRGTRRHIQWNRFTSRMLCEYRHSVFNIEAMILRADKRLSFRSQRRPIHRAGKKAKQRFVDQLVTQTSDAILREGKPRTVAGTIYHPECPLLQRPVPRMTAASPPKRICSSIQGLKLPHLTKTKQRGTRRAHRKGVECLRLTCRQSTSQEVV